MANIDYDNVIVCPGCQAIGSEPHPSWCPDWRIECEQYDRENNAELFDDESEAVDHGE